MADVIKNYDLHCHSRTSDGLLTPTDLIARAAANGVDVLALTDHDETGGLAEAAIAAGAANLTFVNGVEISVTWEDETIHIVGLRIAPENATLKAGLDAVRSSRSTRAEEIAQQLSAVGIEGSLEGAHRFAGNPLLISRTHFARFLVETGRCGDVKSVFNKYLVAGKPGYVPHRWADLEDAVAWIRAAGGRAVVAHPGRYKLTPQQRIRFLQEFKEVGGEAIEVVTGSHTVQQFGEFGKIAKDMDFLASRGSDFHGPGESHTDLGRLRNLPSDLKPVWHDWGLG